MRAETFVLSIDQGTTGSRAILYNSHGRAIRSAYQEFRQYYPKPGWVEHDPEEIWASVRSVIQKVVGLKKGRIKISAVGITNQRETVVVWNRKTGKAVCPAIVWQDRRTAPWCRRIKQKGLESKIRKKTGLVIDPYFSASKICWILDHHPRIRRQALRNQICFGTIDSWIIWKLTGGKNHVTDLTNASRTLLFNIHSLRWDQELLALFKIPPSILPEVKSSASCFGETIKTGMLPAGIPIRAVMGDQQAALYGQGCYRAGTIKNTYGTGCFVVMHLGKRPVAVPPGLLLTLACDLDGKPAYAFEGSIFIAGAAVQWLRDGLLFFKKAKETEKMIRGLKDSGGVTVIPAFAGLGAPYWNPNVRGVITGITRGTTRAHIIRATLESIAHQTADVIDLMKQKSKLRLEGLRVDGGATSNRFLMQFQADILNCPVECSDIQESTAWGVAKLAGHSSGLWKNLAQVDRLRRYTRYFPEMSEKDRANLRRVWGIEVSALLHAKS